MEVNVDQFTIRTIVNVRHRQTPYATLYHSETFLYTNHPSTTPLLAYIPLLGPKMCRVS